MNLTEDDTTLSWLRDNIEIRNGDLYWKRQVQTRGHRRNLARPAGYTNNDGYVVVKVSIDGVRKAFYAHRISFALTHGKWPSGQIDHKDGRRSNNDPSNIRESDYVVNNRNRSLSRNNTSGFTGISYVKRRARWRVTVGSSRSGNYVGSFRCLGQAIRARRDAAAQSGGYTPRHGKTARPVCIV